MNLMTQVGYLLENKNEGEDGQKIFVYLSTLRIQKLSIQGRIGWAIKDLKLF